jgi:hypothetical protein
MVAVQTYHGDTEARRIAQNARIAIIAEIEIDQADEPISGCSTLFFFALRVSVVDYIN